MNLPPVTSINKIGADEITLRLSLNEEMDVFAGHFPGTPILPGVVQVDWALRLATEYLGVSIPAARRFQVKFRQIIRPDADLSLLLKRDNSRGKLSFTYLSGETIAASGTIALDAA